MQAVKGVGQVQLFGSGSLLPVVVTDACGAGDPSAAKRSLGALATAGDAILTDIPTITGLLAQATTSDPRQAAQEVSNA